MTKDEIQFIRFNQPGRIFTRHYSTEMPHLLAYVDFNVLGLGYKKPVTRLSRAKENLRVQYVMSGCLDADIEG